MSSMRSWCLTSPPRPNGLSITVSAQALDQLLGLDTGFLVQRTLTQKPQRPRHATSVLWHSSLKWLLASSILAVSWQITRRRGEMFPANSANIYNYEPQYSEGPAHEVAPFSRVSIAQHSEGMGHGSTAPLSRTPVKRMRGDTRQAHEGGHPTNA